MKPRDFFVGWSTDTRMANIWRVIYKRMFQILPSLPLRDLASQVLRRSTERIAWDWEAKYGVRPILVYSYTGESAAASGLPAILEKERCDETQS